jgi:hypothetical protein
MFPEGDCSTVDRRDPGRNGLRRVHWTEQPRGGQLRLFVLWVGRLLCQRGRPRLGRRIGSSVAQWPFVWNSATAEKRASPWLRDPDRYLVVLASPDGESPWPDPRSADAVPGPHPPRTPLLLDGAFS